MGKRKAAPLALDSILDGRGFDRNLELELRSQNRDTELLVAISGVLNEQARRGRTFQRGRKPGTGSPIRKAIAKLLNCDGTMKNAVLWESIAKKPPKGYALCTNEVGKYVDGPAGASGMDYGRFCNVAAEERGKLKTK